MRYTKCQLYCLNPVCKPVALTNKSLGNEKSRIMAGQRAPDIHGTSPTEAYPGEWDTDTDRHFWRTHGVSFLTLQKTAERAKEIYRSRYWTHDPVEKTEEESRDYRAFARNWPWHEDATPHYGRRTAVRVTGRLSDLGHGVPKNEAERRSKDPAHNQDQLLSGRPEHNYTLATD